MPERTVTGAAPALRELGYWLHRYRRIWRGTVVISVANPLLFLTALGAGLGKLINTRTAAALHGTPYLHFVLPGLLAAAAMQTTYVEAAGPVLQSVRTRGNYRAAATTPLDPTDILYGHLLFILLRVTMTGAMFALVGAAFGTVGATRALLLAPCTTLIGLAFATPVAAWAVTVSRPASLTMMMRFAILPLYMFSGTFFPTTGLPGPLRDLAEATPLWHGVELCRSLALGTATAAATAVHVGYLAAMAAVGLWAARRSYRRVLHA
ncbi:ABC transporter permease [Streptacidiphilus anmyonensis]|uniref:ABC transporter permease n=1 Tax=Streptacidiphilus anmyonensis TaxID=405782 RepID=UPI0005A5F66D|nr:ABC transporter permease [Streptacidiphilus anmyonensis]